jgi:hypothetical protein
VTLDLGLIRTDGKNSLGAEDERGHDGSVTSEGKLRTNGTNRQGSKSLDIRKYADAENEVGGCHWRKIT